VGRQLFVSISNYFEIPAVYPKAIQSEQLCPEKQEDFPIWPCFRRGLPSPWYYYQGGRLLPCLFTIAPKISRLYIFCGTFRY